ncbi:MAG: hypothetical protein J6X84_06985 [Treponema sp.]|nr:hypothetical protein [Treponema sp.]
MNFQTVYKIIFISLLIRFWAFPFAASRFGSGVPPFRYASASALPRSLGRLRWPSQPAIATWLHTRTKGRLHKKSTLEKQKNVENKSFYNLIYFHCDDIQSAAAGHWYFDSLALAPSNADWISSPFRKSN